MDYEIIQEIERFNDNIETKKEHYGLQYKELKIEVIDNSIFLYVICNEKEQAEKILEHIDVTPYNHIEKHKVLTTNIKSDSKASFVIHRYHTTELKKLKHPGKVINLQTLKKEIRNQRNIL